jgi:hypothetical protein
MSNTKQTLTELLEIVNDCAKRQFETAQAANEFFAVKDPSLVRKPESMIQSLESRAFALGCLQEYIRRTK